MSTGDDPSHADEHRVAAVMAAVEDAGLSAGDVRTIVTAWADDMIDPAIAAGTPEYDDVLSPILALPVDRQFLKLLRENPRLTAERLVRDIYDAKSP